MKPKIIGRDTEIKLLNECYNSNKAELVVVYGRRRIGKTFLVKSLFEDRFDFFITGKYEGKLKDELELWNRKLVEHSAYPYTVPKSWNEAFAQLKHYINNLSKDRVVVFLDEMPWLATPKSGFVGEFENFWNDWASTRENLLLIICGSATTWMNDNVISQKGGLHNRVTRKIKLSQFNLHETELFLKDKGIVWNRHQIAECYMIMGGTPYYLDLLQKGMSLPQNIDFLFFRSGAELAGEYTVLLKSLFKDANLYRRIIELLAKHSRGMTRKEICEKLKIADGGGLTEVLENLENCDFIRSYASFGKRERDAMFQLTDMFILFFLKFAGQAGGCDEAFWTHSIDEPSRRVWTGYAFEQLCLNHIQQIKECLGIHGILSNVCSWYQKADKEKGISGGQIDLIIVRRDQVINLCEVKFTLNPYAVTAKYLNEMIERMENFRNATKTKYALHLTMISAAGIAQNENSGQIQSVVTLQGLFR